MVDSEEWPDRYVVVTNDEERYSIIPSDRPLPAGWRREGLAGPRAACLDHVEHVWTDLRPRPARLSDHGG